MQYALIDVRSLVKNTLYPWERQRTDVAGKEAPFEPRNPIEKRYARKLQTLTADAAAASNPIRIEYTPDEICEVIQKMMESGHSRQTIRYKPFFPSVLQTIAREMLSDSICTVVVDDQSRAPGVVKIITPSGQVIDFGGCYLVRMTEEPKIEDFEKVIKSQYILTGEGLWYFNPEKMNLRKLDFVVGKSPASLADKLGSSEKHDITEQEQGLIRSYTRHTHFDLPHVIAGLPMPPPAQSAVYTRPGTTGAELVDVGVETEREDPAIAAIAQEKAQEAMDAKQAQLEATVKIDRCITKALSSLEQLPPEKKTWLDPMGVEMRLQVIVDGMVHQKLTIPETVQSLKKLQSDVELLAPQLAKEHAGWMQMFYAAPSGEGARILNNMCTEVEKAVSAPTPPADEEGPSMKR